MASVKKITAKELKKIIYEEKVKLGLVVEKKLSKSSIIKRQIVALRYLKEQARKANTKSKLKLIKEARIAIKRELLRSL